MIKENKDIIEEYADKDELLKEKLHIVNTMKVVVDYHDRVINSEDFKEKEKEG
jgi:predicted ribosome quality control (RQC) complex YloA/Tae2 family protein